MKAYTTQKKANQVHPTRTTRWINPAMLKTAQNRLQQLHEKQNLEAWGNTMYIQDRSGRVALPRA